MRKLGKMLVAMLTMAAMSAPAQAQLYMEENFDYEAGNLHGQGEWVRYSTASMSPIQVIEHQLTYSGYADAPVGKAVELTNTSTNIQKLCKKFSETDVRSGSVYYSFLLNVKSVTTSKSNGTSHFAALLEKRGSTFADGYRGNEYGKLFAKESSEGHFKLGVLRSTGQESNIVFSSEEYQYNETYLVVVKYQVVGENSMIGESNDIVSLFVNPAVSSTEPTPTVTYEQQTGSDFKPGSTTGGLIGFQLNQGLTSMKNAPNAIIGNVRLAASWHELMKESGTVPVVDKPVLTTDYVAPVGNTTFSKSGFVLVGKEYSATIHLKGERLKGDVTIGGLPAEDLTVSPGTTLSKEAVEAGVDVTFTLNPSKYANVSTNITFNSEDAQELSIPMAYGSCVVKTVENLSQIVNIDNTSGTEGPNNLYLIKGPVTVSHKWVNDYGTYYYLQDENKGAYVCPGDGYQGSFPNATLKLEAGNEVSNLVVLAKENLKMLYLEPWTGMNDDEFALLSENKTVQPRVITLKELKANGLQLSNMMVKIEGVKFGHKNGTEFLPLEDGEVFTADIAKRVAIQDAEGTIAELRVLSGSDLLDKPVPAYGNLCGLSTSSTGMMIAPRYMADIEQLELPVADNNLLDNWSFENWQTSTFGDSPEGWETTLGECTQETTLKVDGDKALRIKAGSKTTSGKLRQELKPEAENKFVPGEKYEMTLHYYVETAASDGKDIMLNSYWKKGDEAIEADAELLNSGESFTSVGAWAEKKIVTTVPEGADGFYFSLKVGKGATVIFDKFGFKTQDNGEASLLVSQPSLSFSSTLNKPQSKEIVVKANGIEKNIVLDVTGAARTMYTVSPQSIPAGQKATVVTVTYHPTEASANHKASLLIDPQTEGLSAMVSLQGAAYDPENPPVITADATELAFEATVGASQTKTLKVSSRNILDYFITAKVVNTALGLFTLSTGSVVKNQEAAELNITFTPKEAGTFNQTVELTATFAPAVRVKLTGIATGSSEPEKEGDDFPLVTDSPLKLMIENFGTTEKNKPVSLNQWKNVAAQGKRAWWGYDFDGEKTAKVTAYDSKATADYPVEMWLVTPPLDFKASGSKVFTFRVMGNYLFDGMDAKLEVCYMDMSEGKLYSQPIDGLNLPAIANDNEDWREIHLDFSKNNLADVFFIGFHFTGTGGTANSATYYVDDVTWGRTDIPMLTPSVESIAEEVAFNTQFTSKPVSVTTANTTEAVTLKLMGPNASKFKLSTATLSAEGGEFTISFKSDQEGVHEAAVKISSRGAADKYLPVVINNKKIADGISEIETQLPADGIVYDLGGRAVYAKDGQLKKGVYIVPMPDGRNKTIVIQ
ncbi:MAG: choice-of-anchor J domain-containing protein [Prevotella sp.]|nr:choice-of-anchor J domain-containing protein [Prevotella sp.]